MDSIWLMIGGTVLLVLAGFLESYCSVSRQSAERYRAKIFVTRSGLLFEMGWMLLLLGAGLLLFLVNPIAALVAIAVFWLVLPLWIMPMMRRRLLPTWDMVKDELEVQGYTEANFLSGDWWKKKKK